MESAAPITDPERFAALCRQWADCPILYLDTEFERVRSYWPRLALLQVHDGETIHLVDPLAGLAVEAFRPLLADPGITKVMHSASEDLVVLSRAFGLMPTRLFDTQIGATLAGFGPGSGYQRLVAELLGIPLGKEETRTDWMQRPLSPAQLAYAAADVAHLPALYQRIVASARARGRLDWIYADSQRLVDKVASEANGDPEPMTRFRNAWKLPADVQLRLGRLLDWRERRAIERDRPRTWILDNEQCIALASTEPQVARLRAALGSGPRLPDAALAELAECLAAPADAAEQARHRAEPPLDPAQTRQLQAIKQFIAEQAAELELPAEVLCARRSAERWLRTGRWPQELGGWREPLLREGFEATRGALAGEGDGRA